ncbi:hypothetical protein RhiirA4_516054, partial [Rhizophagus irregularis]
MDEYKNRSQTPYSCRDSASLNRNKSQTPYSRQDDIDASLRRERSRTPYSSIDRRTPYSRQDYALLSRDRSRTPHSGRDDISLRRERSRTPYSSIDRRTSYSRQDYALLSRDGNRTPHSGRDDISLRRERSRTPYSHQGDALLNVRKNKRKESNNGEENHRRNESRERNQKEIAELRLIVSDLTRDIKELRHERETSRQIGSQENRTRIQHSLSPSPSSTRLSKVRKTFEPMNHDYKKAFRNEVIQILKGLDDSLLIDHKERWIDIQRNVFQNTMPVIKKALGNQFQ